MQADDGAARHRTDGQQVAGRDRRRADVGQRVGRPAAQHRRNREAAAHRKVRATARARRAEREAVAVRQRDRLVARHRRSCAAGTGELDGCIGTGEGHHGLAAADELEAAVGDLDAGRVAGVADEAVGRAQSALIHRARGRDALAGLAVAASVLEQGLQAGAADLQRRAAGLDGAGVQRPVWAAPVTTTQSDP